MDGNPIPSPPTALQTQSTALRREYLEKMEGIRKNKKQQKG